ncbi:hypothetical protein C8Q79DRAFT_56302 [Trametes meyenii]|nr:hypothetical protein C8Q79DRAFT_56302 [Trametes meyenii]
MHAQEAYTYGRTARLHITTSLTSNGKLANIISFADFTCPTRRRQNRTDGGVDTRTSGGGGDTVLHPSISSLLLIFLCPWVLQHSDGQRQHLTASKLAIAYTRSLEHSLVTIYSELRGRAPRSPNVRRVALGDGLRRSTSVMRCALFIKAHCCSSHLSSKPQGDYITKRPYIFRGKSSSRPYSRTTLLTGDDCLKQVIRGRGTLGMRRTKAWTSSLCRRN